MRDRFVRVESLLESQGRILVRLEERLDKGRAFCVSRRTALPSSEQSCSKSKGKPGQEPDRGKGGDQARNDADQYPDRYRGDVDHEGDGGNHRHDDRRGDRCRTQLESLPRPSSGR